MDRRSRLEEAYKQAYAAGEELLKALREPVTPRVVDQVDELVSRREAFAQEAKAHFQSGDQVRFQGQLQALIQQQRALDVEMRRFMGELASISQAAVQVKSTVREARQMMNVGWHGRLLDEKT